MDLTDARVGCHALLLAGGMALVWTRAYREEFS